LRGRRSTAAAAALLLAALAAAGCGLGAGPERGDVTLTVTRDYGSRVLRATATDSVRESDTVMRVLEREAEIDTRYGGGFVQSIDGLAGDDSGGVPRDWFFYVDGVESTVGAADYRLRGGEAIWWDYRDWSAAISIPAVVGSWPQPFRDGFDGGRAGVAVVCEHGREACALVRRRLRGVGARFSRGGDGAIRVLVGPWRALGGDQSAALLERGPGASGVFARLGLDGGSRFQGLDEEGRPARAFGPGAGLVAATRRYDGPPTWVVTGGSAAGVAAAARMLDAADLRDHYAVAIQRGTETPLPVR
jgi:hypothetical protein